MKNHIVTVLVTSPDRERSLQIAETLVQERLAACANVVGGVLSVYRWEGEIRRDEEELLILKTAVSSLHLLVDRVRQLHPYELPEIIALPVAGGSAPYGEWVLRETRKDE